MAIRRPLFRFGGVGGAGDIRHNVSRSDRVLRRNLSLLSQLYVEIAGHGFNCLTEVLERIMFGEGSLWF